MVTTLISFHPTSPRQEKGYVGKLFRVDRSDSLKSPGEVSSEKLEKEGNRNMA